MEASLVANSSIEVVFGCSTYQSGDLIKTDRAIDGIFGFGQQDLSVISQLSSRGITPNVFSHCLKGEGSGGGILVLGLIIICTCGALLSMDNCCLLIQQCSPRQATEELSSILITASVSQSATPVIPKGHQCYLVPSSVSEIFPPVALNFAGAASMVLRPEDYLVHYGSLDGSALWCMGFQKAQNQAVTILGDLVLKDKIFVYDSARQRLGWANYDCSLSVNVSVTTGKEGFLDAGLLSTSSSSKNMLSKLISTFISHLVHITLFIGFLC